MTCPVSATGALSRRKPSPIPIPESIAHGGAPAPMGSYAEWRRAQQRWRALGGGSSHQRQVAGGRGWRWRVAGEKDRQRWEVGRSVGDVRLDVDFSWFRRDFVVFSSIRRNFDVFDANSTIFRRYFNAGCVVDTFSPSRVANDGSH